VAPVVVGCGRGQAIAGPPSTIWLMPGSNWGARNHGPAGDARAVAGRQAWGMPVIEVNGLHKEYGPKVAVDDVSFTVEAGEIFGILGPNGAGKTTTVECVTGLRAPDQGVLRVLGRDPRRDHDELSDLVGVQLQDSQLPDKIRVGEALDLYASFYRRPAQPGELLTRLGLAD